MDASGTHVVALVVGQLSNNHRHRQRRRYRGSGGRWRARNTLVVEPESLLTPSVVRKHLPVNIMAIKQVIIIASLALMAAGLPSGPPESICADPNLKPAGHPGDFQQGPSNYQLSIKPLNQEAGIYRVTLETKDEKDTFKGKTSCNSSSSGTTFSQLNVFCRIRPSSSSRWPARWQLRVHQGRRRLQDVRLPGQ